MLPRLLALESFRVKLPAKSFKIYTYINDHGPSTDTKEAKASHHSQKQNCAVLWEFDQMQQQTGHELSFPNPTEQLSPFLSPVKSQNLNVGNLNNAI